MSFLEEDTLDSLRAEAKAWYDRLMALPKTELEKEARNAIDNPELMALAARFEALGSHWPEDLSICDTCWNTGVIRDMRCICPIGGPFEQTVHGWIAAAERTRKPLPLVSRLSQLFGRK